MYSFFKRGLLRPSSHSAGGVLRRLEAASGSQPGFGYTRTNQGTSNRRGYSPKTVPLSTTRERGKGLVVACQLSPASGRGPDHARNHDAVPPDALSHPGARGKVLSQCRNYLAPPGPFPPPLELR